MPYILRATVADPHGNKKYVYAGRDGRHTFSRGYAWRAHSRRLAHLAMVQQERQDGLPWQIIHRTR